MTVEDLDLLAQSLPLWWRPFKRRRWDRAARRRDYSDTSRQHGPQGRMYSLVFHGYGLASPLREMRHTWWGEDGGGYLYCAPGAEIAEALRLRGQWFDGMTDETCGAPLGSLYAIADKGVQS